MNTLLQKLESLFKAAGVAAAIVFLQTLETDAGAQFGDDVWWPVIAALLTLAIAEISKLAKPK